MLFKSFAFLPPAVSAQSVGGVAFESDVPGVLWGSLSKARPVVSKWSCSSGHRIRGGRLPRGRRLSVKYCSVGLGSGLDQVSRAGCWPATAARQEPLSLARYAASPERACEVISSSSPTVTC